MSTIDGVSKISPEPVSPVDVVFVSMPFGPLLSPSIGLGLLQGALTNSPYRAKSLYFTLDFAEITGLDLYATISEGSPTTYILLGEWIFSNVMNHHGNDAIQEYMTEIFAPEARASGRGQEESKFGDPEVFADAVLALLDKLEAFLDQCLDRVLAYQPQVVGFTSVFQQNVASLCLAQRIRQRAPHIKIIFGGANCEGTMGIEMVRQFKFIDAIVSGEGDLIIRELIQCMMEGKDPSHITGVYTRTKIACKTDMGRFPNTEVVLDMDTLPYPVYTDYFEQLALSAQIADSDAKPTIPFETSRGCWWGEIKHCTFCGLNGDTMRFRSKSPDRALQELKHFVSLYPVLLISVVDNILDMNYFKTFLPALADSGLGVHLFFETKANLKKEQIRELKRAGIFAIQPGIESLSTNVLRLMRKGITAIQNIQLLKWCKELGVHPLWNVLWGFPGEPAADYSRIANDVWKISHLAPPVAYASIRLDRFSPNFNSSDELGFTDVKPYPCYKYIYQLDDESLFNIAYFFAFDYQVPQDVESYVGDLRNAIHLWRQQQEECDLFYIDKGNSLLVWDFRSGSPHSLYVLTASYRTLYLMCDGIQSLAHITHSFSAIEPSFGKQDIQNMLTTLADLGLVIHEDDKYLSLAIPTTEYLPNGTVLTKLLEFAREHGTEDSGTTSIHLADVQNRTLVLEHT